MKIGSNVETSSQYGGCPTRGVQPVRHSCTNNMRLVDKMDICRLYVSFTKKHGGGGGGEWTGLYKQE